MHEHSKVIRLKLGYQVLDSPNNFYLKGGVHDCYGVTANNVSNLISNLQLTYISLYTYEVYILH